MAKILFKGNPIHSIGELPKIGAVAPKFTLTKTDLSEVNSGQFKNKKVILNIFPSLDTPICAAAVRKFNEAANRLPDSAVLCISMDLPFAQERFCGAENLQNVIPLSAFRHPEFGKEYGVTMTDGPLAGLLSRAVVILDQKGEVIYTQQVPEITEEPDYKSALAAVSS
jgi:thiol peroxidase